MGVAECWKAMKSMGALTQNGLKQIQLKIYQLFHDGGPYHIETSPLIFSANQWTDFYIIANSVMKEVKLLVRYPDHRYIKILV